MEANIPGASENGSSAGLSMDDLDKFEKLAQKAGINDIDLIRRKFADYAQENATALDGKKLEEKFEQFAQDVASKGGQEFSLEAAAVMGVFQLATEIKRALVSDNTAAAAPAAEAAVSEPGQSTSQAIAAEQKSEVPKVDGEKPQLSKTGPSEEEVERIKRALQQPQQQQQQQPSMAGAFKYLRDAFDFKGKKIANEQRTQAQLSASRLDMQSWLDSRATSDQKLEDVVSLTRSYAAKAPTATPEQLDEMKTKLDSSIGALQRAVDFESRKVVDEVQAKRMGVGEAGDQMKERVKKVSEKMKGLLDSDEVTNNPELKARLEDANEKMNTELQKVIQNLMEMLKRIFSPKAKNGPAPT